MSIAEILFDHDLAAIDDVQTLSWSIHTLTGNVVNHILAFLSVCCDDADARSIGVVYPRYRRLVATIWNFRGILLYTIIVIGLESIGCLQSIFLYPYGVEQFWGYSVSPLLPTAGIEQEMLLDHSLKSIELTVGSAGEAATSLNFVMTTSVNV